MADSKGKVRRRRKDARPQELVEAALQAFSQNGFAGTKIEDIADLAGVAKGTVYRYFETKELLFEAAVRENISPVFASLGAMANLPVSSRGPMPASELLEAVIRRVYDELVDHPTRRVVMQILITEGSRFPQLTEFYHKEVISKGAAILRKVVKYGIETGEFRSSPILKNPEILMSPAIMATVWKMTFSHVRPLNIKQHIKAHIDLILSGLLKRTT